MSTELSSEYITNTNLPPCNRKATNVKDVYNIYDIIPKSKLETLYDQAVEILKGAIEGYSSFIILCQHPYFVLEIYCFDMLIICF